MVLNELKEHCCDIKKFNILERSISYKKLTSFLTYLRLKNKTFNCREFVEYVSQNQTPKN